MHDGPGHNDLGTVDVAVSPEEKFREYLRTQRLRLTPETLARIDEILAPNPR